jgi:hypothetical protein
MRNKTLSEIVSGALSQADASLKLASARDAEPVGDPGDFLASELLTVKRASDDVPGDDDGHRPPEKKKRDKEDKDKDKDEEKKAAYGQVVSDADFALKLAEALEDGSSIIMAKLASGTVHDAPGPQVMESDFINATTQAPKATASVSEKITGPAAHGVGGLPSNKADFTSPKQDRGDAPRNEPGKTAGFTRNKEASARVLRAKIAQAETLMSMGRVAEADRLLNEVKVAQDPSSPQPSMPAHNASFHLDTEPGEASHIPDNSGIIAMTRSQARDSTTREATKHFSEPPKKDPAVAAHTLRTDGQKVSGLLAAIDSRKTALR